MKSSYEIGGSDRGVTPSIASKLPESYASQESHHASTAGRNSSFAPALKQICDKVYVVRLPKVPFHCALLGCCYLDLSVLPIQMLEAMSWAVTAR